MSAAHLHLLLNHIPVIGTVIALFLLGYAALRRDEGLVRVCLGLFAVLGVAAVAAFLTGEPAEEAVEGLAGVSEAVVERHEEAALLATVALGGLGLLAAAALAWFRRRPLPAWTSAVFLVLALVPAVAMAWTANLGGEIRHPEIRATAEAPPAVLAAEAEAEDAGEDD